MTSPNDPQQESLRDRISRRFSTDSRGRAYDTDARFTRNVSWLFYVVIVVIVIVIVAGLGFGFWEGNLKPLASVEGSDVSRSAWEDRVKLEAFRVRRAQTQIGNALAEGSIDSDLADRRFADAANTIPATESGVMSDLVDLLYTEQLAAEEGVELTEEELEAAIAADGSFPEARLVEALFVFSEAREQGEPETDETIAEARVRAEAALAELQEGATLEDMATKYGPASVDSGYVVDGTVGDTAWNEAIFAAEEGDTTEIISVASGEHIITLVEKVAPGTVDEGFVEAVSDEVGESVHRRNVELEALRDKLEARITEDALAAEYEQVELAEIFVARNLDNLDDAAREARVSHVLYQPETPLDEEGAPTPLEDLPADDPAWDAAEAEAQNVAELMRKVEDPETRRIAFAARAERDSDGPSASRGGDLGYFPPNFMTQAFNDAIFNAEEDPQSGDILGPVRTEFGWHVIMFDSFRDSLDDRLATVEEALAAEGATFADVAAEYSDGPEAADGGTTGWHVMDELDDALLLALLAIESGQITEPIDDGDGYRIHHKLDEDTRPLEAEDAARVAETAFLDWYNERYFEAEDDGRVSIDDSVYADGQGSVVEGG